MLGFYVTAEERDIVNGEEIEEARWCTPDEARELIRKNSTAEYFLGLALNEMGRRK